MATTPVSVCNLALQRLGQGPIASLTDGSSRAATCAAMFQQALDAALADYDWKFATIAAALVSASVAVPGWLYVYVRPAGCVKARAILDPTQVAPYLDPTRRMSIRPAPFSEQAFVYNQDMVTGFVSNTANAVLIYTTNQIDPAFWEPGFVTALSWRLAMEMALPITGSGQIMANARSGYEQTMAAAMGSEPRVNTVRADADPDWLLARGGGLRAGRFLDRYLCDDDGPEAAEEAFLQAELAVLDGSLAASTFSSGFTQIVSNAPPAGTPNYLAPADSLNGVPNTGLTPDHIGAVNHVRYVPEFEPDARIGRLGIGDSAIGHRRAYHGTVVVNPGPVGETETSPIQVPPAGDH